MIYNCANWADLPWTDVRPGVRRKAFTGEGATFAMNELQPHHEPRPHKHPYEQIAYVYLWMKPMVTICPGQLRPLHL